ncbi:MAG: hypothetical protein WBP26_03880 [Candidatus Saccharimonadales bacterium]
MTYTPDQVDPTVNTSMAAQTATGTEEPLGKYGYIPPHEQPESLKDNLRASAGNIAGTVALVGLAVNPNAQIVDVTDPAINKVDPEQHQEQMLTESAENASQLASSQAYDQMAQENTIVIPQPTADQNGLGPKDN